ncbi:MAG: ATP-dependent Lon protease, partial [Rickettsiales bacterium]
MKTINPQIFYTVPLRDVVVFPHMTTTIIVGRQKSVQAIENAKNANIPVFVVTQLNPDQDVFDEGSV